MNQPWYFKLWLSIIQYIRKITGHKYGCCDNLMLNCDKCLRDWEDGTYTNGY